MKPAKVTFLLLLIAANLLGVAIRAAANDDEIPKIVKVDGEEELAKDFSLEKAVTFLDRTSMAWTTRHKCFTCHTNYAHLVAVASLPQKPRFYDDVKSSLVEMVDQRWKEKGPRWDAEVVMSAATLALVDRAESKPLSPATRAALDRTWTVQREDGGFDWLKCNWPPMESDDEFGAAMAAIAVSAAPPEYRDSQAAKEGIRKLKVYLANQGLKKLHHQALLLWAENLGGKWLSKQETDDTIQSLLKLQKPDGGWNSATLGKWERDDGKPADTDSSDGYGTGFAVFTLLKAGLKKDHQAIRDGIQWLRQNQRESGRWYTRSLSRDNRHYLTHAGTAMAIMALRSHEETQSSSR